MGNVLITGAGSGLGRALALTYAREGHRVFLSGRTQEKLAIVRNEIEQQGGSAKVIICDVTEKASVLEAINQIEALDILINNAGIGLFGELENLTEEAIDNVLDTNVKGTILITQAALPSLLKSHGRVLNIISTAGLRGKRNESVYCATKFAVRGFTESLQKEWEEQPITATAVYMGGMNTPFWNSTTHVDNPERLKGPEVVADQIYQEDDGRAEIFIDR